MNRIHVRKLGRLSKSYIAGKIHPLTESLGGNVFHEDRLYTLPRMERDEVTRLSTSRVSRLMRDEDDFVIGLHELKEIDQGHFYDVQEDTKKVAFVRDDLLEPVNSSVNVSLYKTDLVLNSKAFYDKTSLLVSSNLGGFCEEAFSDEIEYSSDIFTNATSKDGSVISLSDNSVVAEVEVKRGTKAPIHELTRKSSDKMKFTLRNSLCEFECFITLTYPRKYPRDGKTCKKHLNLFLTHLRKDYKGIKYFWFMEFQARGAPHFHVFLSCMVPGKTYVSPLWYRVVSSGEPSHLKSGTNVKKMRSCKDVARYATAYAKKLTQKMTPRDFRCVGRFWGCSNKLCSPIMELSDLSIRQVQELWSHYYHDINLPSTLRLDKFNGYVWDGHRYAARLVSNYYEAHLRPLIAEVAMLSKAKSLQVSDSEGESRVNNALCDIRDMKRRVSAGSSVWKNLTEAEFSTELKKGTVRLKYLNGKYQHSLSTAYSELSAESLEKSAVSVKEWADWLAYLQLSMELNWANHHKPLLKAVFHTHIATCKDGRIYKRKYRAVLDMSYHSS